MSPRQNDRRLALNDPFLARFLTAPDEASRRRELERILLEGVRPVVDAVVSRFARREFLASREDHQDIEGAVTVRVIRKLQRLAAGEGEPIQKLAEYVAALTQNTITDALRDRYPEMRRLRRRMRHLLKRDDRFAIWMPPSCEPLCGKSSWSGRESVTLAVTPENASGEMCDAAHPAESLLAIFNRAGGPIAFDDLIRLLSKLWGIAEAAGVDVAEVEAADDQPSPLVAYESRRFLETLWSEVQGLRPTQRAALLLNLRDINGSNALALLMILEIATFDQIAAALDIAPEKLAGLWSGLPLDDLTIASMLGLTRQQVINLRRAARERLTRRLK